MRVDMAWVRLDDGYPEHPKVERVGHEAAWLNVCAWAYCARNLTDGFVPSNRVPKLANVKKPLTLVERLVHVNLWEPVEGGYRVHDYLEYNPSRAQILAYHQQQQANGQAGGRATARARARAPAQALAEPSAQANGQQVLKRNSSTSPLSTKPMVGGVVGSSTGARAREGELLSSEMLMEHERLLQRERAARHDQPTDQPT